MKTSLRHTLGLGLLLLAGAAHAATVGFDLHAKSGVLSPALPDGAAPTVLGYTTAAATPVTAPGGPVLVVAAGDVVTVNLTNDLGEATALLFQGQDLAPDTTGAAAGGGTASYTFTASSPGTFLYEAAPLPNAQHQAAMGLHGALVVRPAEPLQAYGSPATAYSDEAVLVLSELDPALHAAPAAFDMRDYAPRYYLINGAAYPFTAPIPTTAGNRVLLRYVNAGIRHHAMTVLGLEQVVVAKDGSPLSYPARRTSETIAPGQTMDAIATVPAGATGQFALYDGGLNLFNNQAAGFGGMLTFLSAGGAPPTAGPTVTSLSLSTDLATLTATIDAGAGGTVSAAQFWVDSGTPIALTGTFGTQVVTVTGAVPTQPPGSHLVSARGQNPALTWGPARTLAFSIDTTGPSTTGLVLAPNPANGALAVALSGTGDDRASGNANVTAAEYWIDAGTHTTMAVNAAAPVASITATIPAATVNALAAGTHLVSVRSRDALLNWGAAATASLVVDKTGPAVSAVAASPNPNNGALPLNATNVAVRVTATFADAASSIAAAEGFIDTVGASGSGFPFVPSDGLFNGLTETGYADIPLSTINQLATGNHALYVHGRDAAGNWGPTGSTVLSIERTPPSASGVVVAPAASNNTAVTVTAQATDAATGNNNIAGGELFADVAGSPGTGSPMTPLAAAPTTTVTGTLPTAVVAGLTAGNHAILVRARDAAGNWSALATGVLLVDRTVPTLGSASLSPATASVGQAVTLTIGGAADPLVGGLASGLAGVGQYWIDGTATPPASPTAFTGSSATFPAPAPGAHLVYVRIQDRAGNWSAVRSAALSVPGAVNDALTITANTNASQNSNQGAPGLLANDQPVGLAGRTVRLASAPVRTSAAGNVPVVTCPANLGTAAAPAIAGNTICTNGAYRVVLTGTGAGGAARQASKRGTSTFTYTETLNGVTTPAATVTVTVQ